MGRLEKLEELPAASSGFLEPGPFLKEISACISLRVLWLGAGFGFVNDEDLLPLASLTELTHLTLWAHERDWHLFLKPRCSSKVAQCRNGHSYVRQWRARFVCDAASDRRVRP